MQKHRKWLTHVYIVYKSKNNLFHTVFTSDILRYVITCLQFYFYEKRNSAPAPNIYIVNNFTILLFFLLFFYVRVMCSHLQSFLSAYEM
jgi:hypothetical protein